MWHFCASVLPLIVAVFLQAPAGQRTAAPDSAAEAGWTQLFNGTDFTGWRLSKPESFRIENGAIAANGRASHAYYDGPFLGHTFRNFELKVDVMVTGNANGGSNGGVYVLTQFEEKGGNVRASGDFPSKGFEIQINNAYARDQVKTGSLYHVADITESPVKDDEWFTFHIIVKDQTITVKVNQTQTVSWTQPADWNGGREGPGRTITPEGGTIALQAHDANSVVYYKNIRIKPLT
jgi:Domain of Unknown Function (DUF1080)